MYYPLLLIMSDGPLTVTQTTLQDHRLYSSLLGFSMNKRQLLCTISQVKYNAEIVYAGTDYKLASLMSFIEKAQPIESAAALYQSSVMMALSRKNRHCFTDMGLRDIKARDEMKSCRIYKAIAKDTVFTTLSCLGS